VDGKGEFDVDIDIDIEPQVQGGAVWAKKEGERERGKSGELSESASNNSLG
jgi:hypothetical protein